MTSVPWGRSARSSLPIASAQFDYESFLVSFSYSREPSETAAGSRAATTPANDGVSLIRRPILFVCATPIRTFR